MGPPAVAEFPPTLPATSIPNTVVSLVAAPGVVPSEALRYAATPEPPRPTTITSYQSALLGLSLTILLLVGSDTSHSLECPPASSIAFFTASLTPLELLVAPEMESTPTDWV